MARSANPTVTIVIPARNEARNLEVILPKLPDVDQIILERYSKPHVIEKKKSPRAASNASS